MFYQTDLIPMNERCMTKTRVKNKSYYQKTKNPNTKPRGSRFLTRVNTVVNGAMNTTKDGINHLTRFRS